MNLDPKKKKVLIIGGCAAVAIIGAFALAGGKKTSPIVPPPSAKEAFAAAQAKVAAERGGTPGVTKSLTAGHVGSGALPTSASTSVKPAGSASVALAPAHASTAAAVVASVSVEAPSPAVAVTSAAASTANPGGVEPSPAAKSTAVTRQPVKIEPNSAAPQAANPGAPIGAQQAPALGQYQKSLAQPTVVTTQGGGYTAQYEALGTLSQTAAVMELQAKIAKLQRDISDSDNPSGGYPPPAATPVAVMPPTSVSSVSVTPAATDDKPAGRDTDMVSVMMVGGRWQGVLRSGMLVHPGSVLSDGWSIESIGPTSYTAARGRQRKTVQIGG